MSVSVAVEVLFMFLSIVLNVFFYFREYLFWNLVSGKNLLER